MLAISFFFNSVTSVLAAVGPNHVLGYCTTSIEIRAIDTGNLDGVFCHYQIQKLRFLCESNGKVLFNVFFSSKMLRSLLNAVFTKNEALIERYLLSSPFALLYPVENYKLFSFK